MIARTVRVTIRFCVLAVLCATCVPIYAQAGPTGTWRVEGAGTPPWEAVLRVDGRGLTGAVSSCASVVRAFEIFDGKIDEDTITFKCRSGDNKRVVTLTGTIHGDEIDFTWKLQVLDGGNTPAAGMFSSSFPPRFTGKRAPDAVDAVAEMAGNLAQLLRGAEFAGAVNLPQKDVKVEGLLFVPEKVRRVRAVIVATAWGRGFDFYDDPQVLKLLEGTESGLLRARTTTISSPASGGYGFLNNAAAGGGDGLLILLQRLAQESGHLELSDVPLLFWGHSSGGAFGSTFAALHPERTIAFVKYQSGANATDLKPLGQIPALFLSGGKDTAVPADRVKEGWKPGRSGGAPWTFAVQPDATHGDLEYLKKADDLMLPWIAAVLRQRLPQTGTTLRTVNDGSAWLGNNQTGEVAAYGTFPGSKAEASWLPDEASARGWRAVIGVGK